MWCKFSPVVVSVSGGELEVNKANEGRCFSVTHANVLVKSVHIDIFLSSSQCCEILSLCNSFAVALMLQAAPPRCTRQVVI